MSGDNGTQNGNGDLSPANPPGRRLRSGFGDPKWWDQVDEETGLTNREKKSLWAKKQVEEGIIGGARPGAGRPRKNKSLAEVVTETASEKKNAERIAKNLIDMATKHPAPSVQLGAIDRLNKFEQDLEKNMRDDEKEARKLTGKPLDQALAQVLAEHGVTYDYEVSPEDIEDV